jgi:hypothetical protein
MKPVLNSASRMRQQITQEAARLMAEEGVIDHQSAKTKAIERLGLPENAARPDNREIEMALGEYLQLFEASQLPQRCKRWRETAVEAMHLLHDFNTYLIGPALSGIITRFSRVQILVITAPESISILLQDNEIPYDQGQRRFRRSTKDYVYIQTYRFIVDEVDVEILCVENEASSRTLLNPIDGKPFRRAGLREVQQLINNTAEAV